MPPRRIRRIPARLATPRQGSTAARRGFSSGFTDPVGMLPSTYQGHATRVTGDAVVRGETGDQSDQESRSIAWFTVVILLTRHKSTARAIGLAIRAFRSSLSPTIPPGRYDQRLQE